MLNQILLKQTILNTTYLILVAPVVYPAVLVVVAIVLVVLMVVIVLVVLAVVVVLVVLAVVVVLVVVVVAHGIGDDITVNVTQYASDCSRSLDEQT